ncbi:hypothetical protein [Isoptericola hypogeus]|uniref:hypothetical protein n=1 Tax=Isoptericola hypogeus TaxID=300179 RepID=UPI0031DBDBF7
MADRAHGGGAEGAVDDGTRVPYRRWRRWVRSLRRNTLRSRAAESGHDPHDRVYLAYGVVLLGLVYGPIAWSALAQAASALRTTEVVAAGVADGPAVARLVAGGLLALGVAGAGALAAARAGGPLWASRAEVTFALSGQFPPRAVLRRRAAALVAGAAIVGAFGATALAWGAGDDAATVLAWGACGACLAQVPLAVGAAAQTPRWRRAAWTVVGLLLGLGGLAALGAALTPAAAPAIGVACLGPDGDPAACAVDAGLAPGLATGGLLVGAGLVGLACVLLVLVSLPDEVDVDAAAAGHRRTVAAVQGLAGGESGAVADVLGPSVLSGRRATFWPSLLGRAPLVARDLLGLRRRPGALAGSAAVGVLGALLVLLGGAAASAPPAGPGAPGTALAGTTLAAVVGAALLYAASATWSGGLRALAAQPEPGTLLPGRIGRQVAAHAVVPSVVAAVVTGLGVAVATLLDAAGSAGLALGAAVPGLVLVLVLVVVLAARVWVAGATSAPSGLFTPMSTPDGDASMLVLGAWYLRGWLVVIGAAWLLHRAGPDAGLALAVVLLALAGVLVRSAVRRLATA